MLGREPRRKRRQLYRKTKPRARDTSTYLLHYPASPFQGCSIPAHGKLKRLPERTS